MSRSSGSGLSGDDLLWNWSRWEWQGEAVGNMAPYVSDLDEADKRAPLVHLAQQVKALYERLPHHERMVIIAEYPQRNRRFAGLNERDRNDSARRWICDVTGVHLLAFEYRLYLGAFQNLVERECK